MANLREADVQTLSILGATGSIGQSTLDVVRRNPERYRVLALSGNSNIARLFEQCREFSPRYAVLNDEKSARELTRMLRDCALSTEVLIGSEALSAIAAHPDVDMVMAAIVGAAGLSPTMAAVRAGKRVLLANKEALVMGGKLFTEAVLRHKALLLPVDSEHNAIFQCLPTAYSSLAEAGVHKLLLTGSGGPFLRRDPAELHSVTPAQACAHPNWSMGKKISVDSATMMNKGLEFIEARWLFHARHDQIEVVIHPQSVVHSMVQYIDGSVVAQMGRPDMRTPIASCMAWPERIPSGVEPLDFTALSQLTFAAPDFQRFPCLKLAIDASEAGADYAVVLNAANEVAVDLFLREELSFTLISRLIAEVLDKWQAVEPDSIAAVIDADRRARDLTSALASSLKNTIKS